MKKLKKLKKGLISLIRYLHMPLGYASVFLGLCLFAFCFCIFQALSLDFPFENAFFYQQKLWKYTQLYPFFKGLNSHPLILPLAHAFFCLGGVSAWLFMIRRFPSLRLQHKNRLIVLTLAALISLDVPWEILKRFFHELDVLFFMISWGLAFAFLKKRINKILAFSLGALSLWSYSFLKESPHVIVPMVEKILLIPFFIPPLSYFLSWLWKKYPRTYFHSFWIFFLILFILVLGAQERPLRDFGKYLALSKETKKLRNYFLNIPSQSMVLADRNAGAWIANREKISEWPNTSAFPGGCPELIVVRYASGGTITEHAVQDMILRCKSPTRELGLNADLKTAPSPLWKQGIWSSYLVKSVLIRVKPLKKKRAHK